METETEASTSAPTAGSAVNFDSSTCWRLANHLHMTSADELVKSKACKACNNVLAQPELSIGTAQVYVFTIHSYLALITRMDELSILTLSTKVTGHGSEA